MEFDYTQIITSLLAVIGSLIGTFSVLSKKSRNDAIKTDHDAIERGIIMKTTGRYWCWWMHRYLWFVSARNDKYVFEDAADVRFTLTEEQVMKLERR